MSLNKILREGIDFYYNEVGLMVFTEQYHLDKGTCCGNGCKHCPFAFARVPEPIRSELLQAKNENKIQKKNNPC